VGVLEGDLVGPAAEPVATPPDARLDALADDLATLAGAHGASPPGPCPRAVGAVARALCGERRVYGEMLSAAVAAERNFGVSADFLRTWRVLAARTRCLGSAGALAAPAVECGATEVELAAFHLLHAWQGAVAASALVQGVHGHSEVGRGLGRAHPLV